jgi:sucrose-phosphate synthase
VLVDPTKTKAIGAALRRIITDKEAWETYSKNGIMNVRNYYTWESHAKTYAKNINTLTSTIKASDMGPAKPADAIGRRLLRLNYFIISDIDNTLIGEENAQFKALMQIIKKKPRPYRFRGGHRADQ